jgi:hypothetical protein
MGLSDTNIYIYINPAIIEIHINHSYLPHEISSPLIYHIVIICIYYYMYWYITILLYV